jgi:hypothetical protein
MPEFSSRDRMRISTAIRSADAAVRLGMASVEGVAEGGTQSGMADGPSSKEMRARPWQPVLANDVTKQMLESQTTHTMRDICLQSFRRASFSTTPKYI